LFKDICEFWVGERSLAHVFCKTDYGGFVRRNWFFLKRMASSCFCAVHGKFFVFLEFLKFNNNF